MHSIFLNNKPHSWCSEKKSTPRITTRRESWTWFQLSSSFRSVRMKERRQWSKGGFMRLLRQPWGPDEEHSPPGSSCKSMAQFQFLPPTQEDYGLLFQVGRSNRFWSVNKSVASLLSLWYTIHNFLVSLHQSLGNSSVTSWTGRLSSCCGGLWVMEFLGEGGGEWPTLLEEAELWNNGALSLACSWTGIPNASSGPSSSLPSDVWLT